MPSRLYRSNSFFKKINKWKLPTAPNSWKQLQFIKKIESSLELSNSVSWKWKKNEIVKGGCRLKMDQMKQDLRMVIEKFYELSQALVIIHMWKVCY